MRIYPLGLGKYGDQTAVFLGRRKDVGNVVGGRLEALPVPIFASGDLEMLVAAFRARERGNDGDNSSHKFKPSVLWAGRHLATKDDGLFDNSPWEWVDKGGEGGGEGGGGGEVAAATTVATAAAVARSAAAAAEAKKEAYNAFVFGRNVDPSKFSSPYALMLHVVRVVVGAVVLELLIDEEDSPRGPGITFGPVVLLQEDVSQGGESLFPQMLSLPSQFYRLLFPLSLTSSLPPLPSPFISPLPTATLLLSSWKCLSEKACGLPPG